MSSRPRPDQLEERRRDGAKRNEEWAKLTPQQRLDVLDARLGKGVGATKQRKQLAVLLQLKQQIKAKGGAA